MMKMLVVAGVVVGIIGILVIANASNNPGEEQVAGSRYSQIEQDVQQGAILLDVRTVEEYADGHITGATLLSLQDLQVGEMPKVDKEKTIYVYCRSGNRSAEAASILRKEGYRVMDLGGINEVQAMGGMVVR